VQLHSTDANRLPTADVLVLGLPADGPAGPIWDLADKAAGGALGRLKNSGDLTGKKFEVTSLLGLSGLEYAQVLVVGLGPQQQIDAGVAYFAAAAGTKAAAAKPRGRVAFALAEAFPAAQREALLIQAVAGAVVGCSGQDLYRQEKRLHEPGEQLWPGASPGSLEQGHILGESVRLARRLVNEPPQVVYPESFAERAAAMADDALLEIEVWDQARLEAERCGSLLAVAKGSSQPPRLVILSHRGGAENAPTLALVGKGVTFDSGGLSLKESDSMFTMKCDMAGAAAVVGAMRAIGLLRLPVNVIGLVGLVENMPGPAAMKLGDVLTARNGRTIEVHNTDAEGRLVLADVLSVAVDRGASKIIDLATLTGACMVALGRDVAGLMTNDTAWGQRVGAAAQAVGEPAWPLPMFKEYDELIKSEVADIKNMGDGRWGGAITAAKFLEQFVGQTPWVHLDIAGPAFAEKPKPWLDGGGTGAFVRTLVEVAQQWAK
jgi:leucyl aminopeptidase